MGIRLVPDIQGHLPSKRAAYQPSMCERPLALLLVKVSPRGVMLAILCVKGFQHCNTAGGRLVTPPVLRSDIVYTIKLISGHMTQMFFDDCPRVEGLPVRNGLSLNMWKLYLIVIESSQQFGWVKDVLRWHYWGQIKKASSVMCIGKCSE